MKKNILNLTGAQELSKDSQQSIKGGITQWMAANCIRKKTPTCDVDGEYYHQLIGWCCRGTEPQG
ncbi:hypothetical protein [Flavobacterium sp. '19STA2R22 D10 B1']|uniref:hypothetical protein n=1 Tax=Flavobacterium aerium TaxID=3037261 RepID=UPI00278C3BD5|nr:hypothetical protein [Flavobacterium sp. '19STA2R22 D10 B1']